jgi:hypothetical protein
MSTVVKNGLLVGTCSVSSCNIEMTKKLCNEYIGAILSNASLAARLQCRFKRKLDSLVAHLLEIHLEL